MISACIASILRAVSRSVSPLQTLLPEEEMLITSAESRLAATSKEVRVRVLGSKKRLTTVFPRRAGTFLICRVLTSLNDSAVCSTSRISSTPVSRSDSRSLCFSAISSLLILVSAKEDLIFFTLFFEVHFNFFVDSRRKIFSDVVRPDRQFAMTSINQDGELDQSRSSKIHEAVERGADRPSGIEDVVHQDDFSIIQIGRNVSSFDRRVPLSGIEVIPVKGHIELP